MKCHPEYLISEWLFHRRISTCEMVNASRHTSNLPSGSERLQKASGPGRAARIDGRVVLRRSDSI